MSNNKKIILGVDTSNYTTSLAAVDTEGAVLANVKVPLRVSEGARGLRQSDAVFEHTRNIPAAIEMLCENIELSDVIAVGYSEKPRNAEGAYMPCFLSGVATAKCLSAATGADSYPFSHQDGHIRAACHSAGFDIKDGEAFAAFHVSGGTTELLHILPKNGELCVTLIGETKDLNAGQLVDRIGVKMGITFPCGAQLDKLALECKEQPKGIKICVNGLDCNLSGAENLAASVLQRTNDKSLTAAYTFSFVAKTLSKMTANLRERYPDIPVVYAGGVMGSKYIKGLLKFKNVYFAEPQLSSDNAVGVALLAREKWLENDDS